MDVSIIIVNFNTKEMTSECLDSIFNHTHGLDFEVILVDNNSNDGSVELFQNDSRIIFIDSSTNLGFGRANNLGYSYSTGKYILLLNSDTYLLNNAIFEFYHFAENFALPYGAIGSLLYNAKNEIIHSYGQFPTVKSELIRCLRSVTYKLVNGSQEDFIGCEELKSTGRVDYVTGADLFIKREVIDRYGLFDPMFFMYYEETDLQYRLTKEGLYSYVISTPKIVHLIGASNVSRRKYQKLIMMEKSKLYYLYKTTDSFVYAIFRILYFLLRIPIIFSTDYTIKERFKYLHFLTNKLRKEC